MGCKGCKKQKQERSTKENVEKIANKHTELTGEITEVVVKIIAGVEVYDYTIIRDEKGNIIYTDKQDEKEKD